ncbi:ATP-binding protein [Streptomyces sp. NPDC048106]|uniref:ATP-binding protein n=1 Tax=Streptomyces sp. NPDC048106 TaxID=3155750 RepID=UPI003453FE87
MKQSAAKTLGVAALGAAFAALGAGAAHAAPAADATQTLNGVTRNLPAESVVPGTVGTLAQGQGAVASGVAAAQPAVRRMHAQGSPGMLGGLPLNNTGLPTQGMGVNGVPLG